MHSNPAYYVSALVAQLCTQHGMSDFVIGPGSRSAPLALALARTPGLCTRIMADERGAGYAALGLSQYRKQVAGVLTTSGTAVLNLAPAVAEAFFQQVPLLVLTADRPPEWIAQQDGQTLHQYQVFGPHVKGSWQMPTSPEHPDALWQVQRIVNEALLLARQAPMGPVHINIPFREPFYPQAEEPLPSLPPLRVWQEEKVVPKLSRNQAHDWVNRWLAAEKKLIVVGQRDWNLDLNNVLYACGYYNPAPILGEMLANTSGVEGVLHRADSLLGGLSHQQAPYYQPDLLVTLGGPILGKNLKNFLRKYPAKEHWHIQSAGPVADPLQSITHVLRVDETDFITRLGEQGYFQTPGPEAQAWKEAWQALEAQTEATIQQAVASDPDFELSVVEAVLQALPDDSVLHVSNSMPVRWASLRNLPAGKRIEVFGNRGTSGIDGCTSTAVGSAWASGKPTVLITGDTAFFYDRNALFTQDLPPNLTIVVLNNGGGAIFRMLEGPARQPELETHFEARHGLTAERTAQDFGLEYAAFAPGPDLSAQILERLVQNRGKAQILEIRTDPVHTAQAFRQLKEVIAQVLSPLASPAKGQ